MVAALVIIAFFVVVAGLIAHVRQVSLVVGAIVLTLMLVLALIAQATISSRLGGYAALGLAIAVVIVG